MRNSITSSYSAMQSTLHGNVTGHQAEKADLSAFETIPAPPPFALSIHSIFTEARNWDAHGVERKLYET